MKVVLLTFAYEEFTFPLANALAREVEVHLVTPEQGLDMREIALGVEVHPFFKPRLRQPWQQLKMTWKLLRLITDLNPDVIHIQEGYLWFNMALPLLGSYPLVITVHDARHHIGDQDAQKSLQPIMDAGFRRARRLIVHCERVRQDLVEQVHIPSDIIHITPLLIADQQDDCAGPRDNHLILFLGRIWEYKGLEYLIRAEPLITAQLPESRIVIAGQGQDFSHYQRMLPHPENFIVMNQYIGSTLRAELFRQASVVVLPYVDATQSGVIPRAYSCAKPVVATTVGGLPEMVEDGRTGYLVPPRDERALAEAIVRILKNPELGRQLGANGRHKFITEWSPQGVAERTLAIYDQAFREAHSRQKARNRWTDTSVQE